MEFYSFKRDKGGIAFKFFKLPFVSEETERVITEEIIVIFFLDLAM